MKLLGVDSANSPIRRAAGPDASGVPGRESRAQRKAKEDNVSGTAPSAARRPVRTPTGYTPELERHEFRCERCGYEAIACIAPSRCPMCGATVWSLSTGMRKDRSDDWRDFGRSAPRRGSRDP